MPSAVAVREAEREARPKPERCELGIDGGEVKVALALQDLARDGAGVFGVRVDRAALQRLVEDRGVAEPGRCSACAPARRTVCVRISPRTYDSVKRFEPMRSGSSAAATEESRARKVAAVRRRITGCIIAA
jgi:hypothetical protein